MAMNYIAPEHICIALMGASKSGAASVLAECVLRLALDGPPRDALRPRRLHTLHFSTIRFDNSY